MLRSTQFRTLAATGTSASGVTDARIRAVDEERIFGIELNAPPGERPIYGYLEGSDESGAVATFGPIVIGFNDTVREHATFVLGDSRDATLGAPVFAPVPIESPAIDGVSNAQRDLLTAKSLADACAGGYRYAEVQIHCRLGTEDIARVVYTRGTRPSRLARELLAPAGLCPTLIAGDDPGPSARGTRGATSPRTRSADA